MGPSLRDPDWMYGSSECHVFSSIAEGRAHGMPAWGTKLPQDQIWKLVAYIVFLCCGAHQHLPQRPEDRRRAAGVGLLMRTLRLAAAALAGAALLAARADDTRTRASGPLAEAPRVLRVCADPNNLPFSNDRGEGLDNALARLVARDLGASLEYTWMPQRRGFVRHTLAAGDCDAMMEAPVGWERVLTTRPLYRSSYVFVVRSDRDRGVRSLDDPGCRPCGSASDRGDNYANTTGGGARAARSRARSWVNSVNGDYSRPHPPSAIVEAVAAGDVDLALAWGPMASTSPGGSPWRCGLPD